MNKFGFVNIPGQSSEIDDNLPHNFVPRSSYTNQIMDILKNVARQKEETTKVKHFLLLQFHKLHKVSENQAFHS